MCKSNLVLITRNIWNKRVANSIHIANNQTLPEEHSNQDALKYFRKAFIIGESAVMDKSSRIHLILHQFVGYPCMYFICNQWQKRLKCLLKLNDNTMLFIWRAIQKNTDDDKGNNVPMIILIIILIITMW